MGPKERQLSYSNAFKIEVMNYAEKHEWWINYIMVANFGV